MSGAAQQSVSPRALSDCSITEDDLAAYRHDSPEPPHLEEASETNEESQPQQQEHKRRQCNDRLDHAVREDNVVVSAEKEQEEEVSPPSARERKQFCKSDELRARKEILVAQVQTHEKCRDADNTIWQIQSGAYQAVFNRLLVSKKTAADLHLYLKDRLRRLSALFKTDTSDVSFGENEIGSLQQATISLELLTRNGEQQFNEAHDGVFKQTIASAAAFEKESSKRITSLRQKMDRLAETVSGNRVVTERAWEQYENAMRETLLQEAEGRMFSGDRDPYLLARCYLQELSRFRAVQVAYSNEMKTVVERFKVEDGRRINSLKDILLDHLIAEKTILTNKLGLLDASLSAVKNIDREKDVALFTDTCKFLHPDDNGHTAFDTLPGTENDMLIVERLRSHTVWKGSLSRPGKIFRTNWHSGHAVITLAGFLHWFENQEDESPAITVPIRGASVKTSAERGQHVFAILAPKHSFFKLSGAPDEYVFKADDPSSLSEWIAAVSDAIDRTTTP